jgi:hypothetical protein
MLSEKFNFRLQLFDKILTSHGVLMVFIFIKNKIKNKIKTEFRIDSFSPLKQAFSLHTVLF